MDNRPIGVYDSGLGGLSVWRVIKQALPHESLIYFGDGKNCPYGHKSKDELLEYAVTAVDLLLSKDIKMLVIACNAATAMTVDFLRKNYDLPIVGMEPAVKPAALNSQSGVIGVLATAATFKGDLFKQTAQKYSDKVEIVCAVGEGFVEAVERNKEHSTETYKLVKKAMKQMIEKGADKVVLGCTHYPFLMDAINEAIGDKDMEVIDPAPAITKRVKQLMEQYDLFAEQGNVAQYEFYTEADHAYRQTLISKANNLD